MQFPALAGSLGDTLGVNSLKDRWTPLSSEGPARFTNVCRINSLATTPPPPPPPPPPPQFGPESGHAGICDAAHEFLLRALES